MLFRSALDGQTVTHRRENIVEVEDAEEETGGVGGRGGLDRGKDGRDLVTVYAVDADERVERGQGLEVGGYLACGLAGAV